jgi:hypothetical protein
LLFSARLLGCGRAPAVLASLTAAGAPRILPPSFRSPALEIAANR